MDNGLSKTRGSSSLLSRRQRSEHKSSSWWIWWKEGRGGGSLSSISSVKEESRSPAEHEGWDDDAGLWKSQEGMWKSAVERNEGSPMRKCRRVPWEHEGLLAIHHPAFRLDQVSGDAWFSSTTVCCSDADMQQTESQLYQVLPDR